MERGHATAGHASQVGYRRAILGPTIPYHSAARPAFSSQAATIRHNCRLKGVDFVDRARPGARFLAAKYARSSDAIEKRKVTDGNDDRELLSSTALRRDIVSL